MSWFSRKKSWTEKEVLTAEDLGAEFDNVAEALNGLVSGGRVAASEELVLFGVTNMKADVPGATKTITLARASLVSVQTHFHVSMSVGTVNQGVFQGILSVDGAEQPSYGVFVLPPNSNTHAVSVGSSYLLRLPAGSHTLKLRGAAQGNTSPALWAPNTDFTYLILPDPEP